MFAALGRIYGLRHLLSLERIWYYIKPSKNVKHYFEGLISFCGDNQTSLAVLNLTPGPMVEAATQLLIYWPLAVAGLALTIAPIRAL